MIRVTSLARLTATLPPEAAAELPRLPAGVTLDPRVLQAAACATADPDWFTPEPDDHPTIALAKQVCATCPVQTLCRDMAMRTRDEHAILGGLTPQERGHTPLGVLPPPLRLDMPRLLADWQEARHAS